MNTNTLLVHVITFFLGVSLFLYYLLGGADFGAGILELFLGTFRKKERQQLITNALSPVWEANHIWLILVVVILFNGFPGAFYPVSIYLHLPLTVLLIGIIFRGCSFTFRHYDAVKDRSQVYYTILFSLSSVLTPFMLGIIAGAVIVGKIPSGNASYLESYIFSWVHGFPLILGLFVCCLFTFVAAVYLTLETSDPELRRGFVKQAKITGGLSIFLGTLVFGVALFYHLPWVFKFFRNPFSMACIGLSALLLVPLSYCIKMARPWAARILVGGQMALILLGFGSVQFPVLVQMDHTAIDLYQAAAPPETLWQLLYALLVGSALIFPALGYLFKIFKTPKIPRQQTNELL